MKNKIRCGWCGDDELYQQYHDNEWGKPLKDDQRLFEMLILEGLQAGLSWITVLKKREHYRKVFNNFDVVSVSEMSDDKLEELLLDPGIIRNRLKVYGTRKNAIAFMAVQKEFTSFKNYIWGFVDNKPIVNRFKVLEEIPAKTELSDIISKDLKKRGFTFIGSTIVYAYMQAIGMVNDHLIDCFCYSDLK